MIYCNNFHDTSYTEINIVYFINFFLALRIIGIGVNRSNYS